MSFDIKLSNGDIVVNNYGEVQIVENLDKLKQDVAKILLTQLGENVYHSWYGSQLTAAVIGRATTARIIARDAEFAISNSLDNLASLQIEQMSFQSLSPQEVIASISDLVVEQELSDPRQWNISLTVLSRSGTEVTENFSIRI